MKNKKVKPQNKLALRSPWAIFAFAVLFAFLGYGVRGLSHAAGGSLINVISNSTDGTIHYSNQVAFNWSTTYKNTESDTYFNPNVELICYQNGKWTGMGHVYRLSGSPTPYIGLTGIHTYTFAQGDLNRVDYSWFTDPSQLNQSQPESCRAALYHFSKNNNKYSELAYTTFQVNP